MLSSHIRDRRKGETLQRYGSNGSVPWRSLESFLDRGGKHRDGYTGIGSRRFPRPPRWKSSAPRLGGIEKGASWCCVSFPWLYLGLISVNGNENMGCASKKKDPVVRHPGLVWDASFVGRRALYYWRGSWQCWY
jgi:hypothetical protein